MTHVSYSELRKRLAHYMDEVCDSRAPLHVTRQNEPSVVVISEAEYDGMMETLHLLHSPSNAERLLRSVADAEAGKLTEHDLAERTTKS